MRKDKVSKKVRKIRKENPLYLQDGNGTFRKLENISTSILDKIIVSFFMGNTKARYDRLNRDAIMNGTPLAPISFSLEEDFHGEFDFLINKFYKQFSKKDDIVIFYGAINVPLVRLYKDVKKDI